MDQATTRKVTSASSLTPIAVVFFASAPFEAYTLLKRRFLVKSAKLLILMSVLLVALPQRAGGRPGVGLLKSAARVVTLLDYFEGGQRAVDAFVLLDSPGDRRRISSVLERSKRSCVRVEIRIGEEQDRYQSLNSSGVLIDGGRRVLTAGHAMDGSSDAKVLIKLLDGRTRRARLLASEYEVYGGANRDWAVLQIVGPPVESFPSAKLGEVRTDEPAFVLGYPDQIGVDAAGRVAFDSVVEARYLEPLVTLATVEQSDPLRLSPLVGSVPTSGMSGAPVFDTSGRLIGVFVSVGKASTASSVSYTYNVASVEALREKAPWPQTERRALPGS